MRLRSSFTMILSGLCLIGLTASCTKFPELDDQISQEAMDKPYPDLVPVENLHMAVPEARITPETGDNLEARIEALQRRADAIRGPVLDTTSRRRLEGGVARPNHP